MLKDVRMYIINNQIKFSSKPLISKPNIIPFICTPTKTHGEIDERILQTNPTNQLVYILINGGKELYYNQTNILEHFHCKLLEKYSSDIIIQHIAIISENDLKILSRSLNKYLSPLQISNIRSTITENENSIF